MNNFVGLFYIGLLLRDGFGAHISCINYRIGLPAYVLERLTCQAQFKNETNTIHNYFSMPTLQKAYFHVCRSNH